jgi:hypothetical protein
MAKVFIEVREPEKNPDLIQDTGPVRFDFNPKASQSLLRLHCPVCGQSLFDEEGFFRRQDEFCPHLVLYYEGVDGETYVKPSYKRALKMLEEGYDVTDVVEDLEKDQCMLAFFIKGQYLAMDLYARFIAVFSMGRVFGVWSDQNTMST